MTKEFNKVAQEFINAYTNEETLEGMVEAIKIAQYNNVGLTEDIFYKYIVTPDEIEMDEQNFLIPDKFIDALMNGKVEDAANIAAQNPILTESPLYKHIASKREFYINIYNDVSNRGQDNESLNAK